MKAGYFVFEKRIDETMVCAATPDTRSRLRDYLNARLNDGFDAKDFLIIRGREEKITAVKIVAEFKTPEK